MNPDGQDFRFAALDVTHAAEIVELVALLNPNVEKVEIGRRLQTQWGWDGYHCFGLLRAGKVVAVASAWISVRLYGGKLVELDNVIVAPEARGGTGGFFLEKLQEWARAEGCVRMELKTYVTNARSHKFYFQHGFDLRAFYFVKQLTD